MLSRFFNRTFQNLGAAIVLRLSGVPLEVSSRGFPLSTDYCAGGLDYGPTADLKRHDSWENFLIDPARDEGRWCFSRRRAQVRSANSASSGDHCFGREKRRTPDEVHAAADDGFHPVRAAPLMWSMRPPWPGEGFGRRTVSFPRRLGLSPSRRETIS